MSDNPFLWEVCDLPGGMALELRAGDVAAMVLTKGENRASVELARVKGLVAALVDGAADLAEVLSLGCDAELGFEVLE